MNENLKQKLANLPASPGIYFHKDAKGQIIYIGKAAVLKNRVRQYFQKSHGRDPKTEALVGEIVDIDWMVVGSELEALFLEAEMVRRYMPRYNILLRDDKSMVYIRIDYNSEYPTVSMTRRPLDDGARYFGPYLSAISVKQALKLLRRVFPFATRRVPGQKRASLHYHLGLDPGLEEGKTSLSEYRANLRKLIAVMEGRRINIEREVERDMKKAAKMQKFEEAAKLRNQFISLRRLSQQMLFSDKEFLDISKDHALNELVDMLGLSSFPRRIEGYDISHQQGTDVVASMVVFTNGVSNKGEYRKFKTKFNRNDDFYNMNETILRRLSDKNVNRWGNPDLVLIDGGKGQLEAAISARDSTIDQARQKTVQTIPFVGLAKRDEQLVIKKQSIANSQNPSSNGSNVILNEKFVGLLGGHVVETDSFYQVTLPKNTNVVKLLQRIRDESHRFAVSYHSILKTRRQTASLLDEIPTIGPATRKKLLKTFGSVKAIGQARDWELEKVAGPKKAIILRQYLRAHKKGVF